MWAKTQCGILLLLVSCAAAQIAAPGRVMVRHLRVVRDSTNLRVEITLSGPIDANANVTLAKNPDRLVLDLPNALSEAKQQQVSVNYKGVRRVRLGLNSANPPVTRVVVDLDQTHPYVLHSDGNRVVLIVSTASNAIAGAGQGAQAAGASGGIVRIFGRRPAAPPMDAGHDSPTGLPAPPPPGAPIKFPEEQADNVASSTGANVSSPPTAAHPDRGSLQEGTFFPALGSPGTASVPTQQGTASTALSTAPTAPGMSQSTGGTTPAGSASAESTAANAKVPSAVVTPTPNPATPAVSRSSGSGSASSAIAAPAQQQKSEPVAVNSQSEPSAGSTSKPADVTPALPKTEPAAAGTQVVALATASSSSAQTEAQKSPSISGTQPASQTTSVPANETSPSEKVVEPPAVTKAPAVAAAAPDSTAAVSTSVSSSSGSGSASSAIAAPAPQPKSEPVSVSSQSEPSASSSSTPAAAVPPQPKTEPAGSQMVAPATASSSLAQTEAQKSPSIAGAQPKTISVPANETSPSKDAAEPSAVTTAPVVAAAEPAPAPVAPDSAAAVSTEVASDKATADANLPVLALRAVDPNLRTVFKVKYVAEGVAYLDGGRSSSLTEGMKLEIRESDLSVQQGTTVDPSDPRALAELEVTALADTSAVTDIRLPKRPVKPGDLAYLSSGDAQTLVQQRTLSATRKYPAVVTFTEGDPMEEEARAEVPRPPQPSVNRARGRIGFDYMGTVSRGSSSATTSNLGMIVRADITRLNGTYWNVSGYWRGRLNSRSSTGQQTLQDLINRTYHLSMTYDNPNSPWVAGFGRLYLPWASSLDTIDGGYFGRRVRQGITAGIFAGSTPDPTSWNYNPDRRIGGTFINFEGGSFDGFHYTSTTGLAVSTLKWQIDRPFMFLENSFSYKRYLSIYHSLQADSPAGNPAVRAPGPGLSRSFLTFRIQPHPRVELDFNQNYFRDVPTFDPQLIGTGLLDKYLFQGFSVGARVEVVKQIFVYSSLGQSSRSGDAKTSLNQMYGLTFNHLPWLGLRADGHYSRFNSSFGSGSYRAVSLSRNLNDEIHLEVLAGDQKFNSLLTSDNRSRFVNTNLDFALGTHYFTQGGFTLNRGQLSYDQWLFTFGYRFDSRRKHQP